SMECAFVSSRRRHTRLVSDWSSDVCSSDLGLEPLHLRGERRRLQGPDDVAHRGGAAAQGRQRRRSDAVVLYVGHVPAPAYRQGRSEERRVGKEWRSRWWADHYKEKREYKTA